MPPVSGSVFDPDSPQVKAMSDLFILSLVIGLGVLMLVTGLVIWNIIRYRRRPGDNTEPTQTAGNTRLEVMWTIGPFALATILMVLTLIYMGISDPPKTAADQQPDIEIVGHQWWWEYRYLKDGNFTTANELHVPTGKRLYIRYLSSDVLHGWWVPQLGRQMDVSPARDNYTWIQSDTPGQYYGACAFYCGGPHAWMLIKVVSQPQAQYDAWAANQSKASQGANPPGAESAAVPAPTAPANTVTPSAQTLKAGGDPARGQKIFLGNTCINCHAINGTNAQAKVGPNLSHFGARSIIGAGVMNNTPENLAKWIYNPQVIKPGVLMPGYQLGDQDMSDLVAYLEGLK